jgi:hypothetical protein
MGAALAKTRFGLLLSGAVLAGLFGAQAAFLAANLITGRLLVNLLASLAVYLLIVLRLVVRPSRSFVPLHPRGFALAFGSGTALALGLAASSPALSEALAPIPERSDQAVVAALRSAAVPLAGVRAGSGFQDLEPLRDILGDKRILALAQLPRAP